MLKAAPISQIAGLEFEVAQNANSCWNGQVAQNVKNRRANLQQ